MLAALHCMIGEEIVLGPRLAMLQTPRLPRRERTTDASSVECSFATDLNVRVIVFRRSCELEIHVDGKEDKGTSARVPSVLFPRKAGCYYVDESIIYCPRALERVYLYKQVVIRTETFMCFMWHCGSGSHKCSRCEECG